MIRQYAVEEMGQQTFRFQYPSIATHTKLDEFISNFAKHPTIVSATHVTATLPLTYLYERKLKIQKPNLGFRLKWHKRPIIQV